MKTLGAEIFSALRAGVEPETVEDLAVALLSRLSESTEEVEGTWHPLGFIHARLFHDGDASLRLHIWPGSARSPAGTEALSPIHDHIWDLVSQILCGELINHIVDVIPSATESATHEMGLVQYQGRENAVEGSGSYVSWREAASQVFRVRDRYHVPPGVFHYTEPGEARPLATIVSALVVRSGSPRTLIPRGKHERATTRALCDPEVLRTEIAAVLEVLQTGRQHRA